MRRREFIGLAGSAAVAVPLSARVQQPMPVIGFLHSGTSEQNAKRLVGFSTGLRDAAGARPTRSSTNSTRQC
jgi:putative ABC transport system substrate-binding protein